MKAILRNMLFVGIMACGSSSFAQATSPAAIVNDKMEFIIPTDVALTSTYVVDISSMNFKDADAAFKFFKSMTDNLVNSTVDYAAGQATIHLHLDYAVEGWGIAEWNNYFVKTSERYRKAFAYFNQ